MSEKKDFLVCYDYGMGGLWGIMAARNAEEILAVYPELSIFEERPEWITQADMQEFSENEWHDINGAPWGILSVVLEDRRRRALER